jgi:DNA/RNA-binding domain of Phe-tRNA-synthetase-like protein
MAIEAEVENRPTPDALWEELTRAAAGIRGLYELSEINKREGISATRRAYKALGKDPNRYRPSTEALCRRAVKGMELYRIDALVDLINLLSMVSGYSIGGFDMDKIVGETLRLGRGAAEEPYEGIGRGALNIEGLPVYRDAVGGVGTPTSDNERTKLDLSTRRLLMCVNIYGVEMPPEETAELATRLLTQYAAAKDIKVRIIGI